MKNERILVADDDKDYRESLVFSLNLLGEEDGHRVIGEASSVNEVETLLQNGLKPTVAFVDNSFYGQSQGDQVAQLIRQFSPETIIISNSMDTDFDWADQNWGKCMGADERMKRLTELQH